MVFRPHARVMMVLAALISVGSVVWRVLQDDEAPYRSEKSVLCMPWEWQHRTGKTGEYTAGGEPYYFGCWVCDEDYVRSHRVPPEGAMPDWSPSVLLWWKERERLLDQQGAGPCVMNECCVTKSGQVVFADDHFYNGRCQELPRSSLDQPWIGLKCVVDKELLIEEGWVVDPSILSPDELPRFYEAPLWARAKEIGPLW